MVVERALRCSKIKDHYKIECSVNPGHFFCSFDTCGQYVKKSGHIILVAFPAI